MSKISSISCLVTAAVLISGSSSTLPAFDGYILFGAWGGNTTVLIDGSNDTLYKWNHSSLANPKNGYSSYLLTNGNLIRSSQTNNTVSSGAAPLQGVLSAINLDGKEVWKFELATSTSMTHHDCKPLPNGNMLVVSFENTSKADAVAKGLDSTLFSGTNTVEMERIIEFKPDTTGANNHQIVWEWKIMDHIVQKNQASQHPEKFSGGMGPFWSGQWVHLNGLDYNPQKDLIVFSSRIFSEVFVIDHSTTTKQAATGTGGNYNKGGDIIYRWGRSMHYGISGKDSLTTLHCPTWIPEGYAGAGNIMFFHNNGSISGYAFAKIGNSQVIELTPPDSFKRNENCAFGPENPTWIYSPSNKDSIYSASMSSAIRMKNGNTIVHEAYAGSMSGKSRLREVKKDSTIVWGPITLSDNTAKVMYYEKDYAGIIKIKEKLGITNADNQLSAKRSAPGMVMNAHSLRFSNVDMSEISFYSLAGKKILSVKPIASTFAFSVKRLPAGTCLVKISGPGRSVTTLKVNYMLAFRL